MPSFQKIGNIRREIEKETAHFSSLKVRSPKKLGLEYTLFSKSK